MDNIKIIVSRYNEELSWTLEPVFNEFKYIVYNKGNNEDFEKINVLKIINIDNVGREGHTYLYHIVENYENLNNILVFLPGSINLGNKKEVAIDLINRIKNNKGNAAVFVGRYLNNGVFDEFKNFHLENWKCTDKNNLSKNY